MIVRPCQLCQSLVLLLGTWFVTPAYAQSIVPSGERTRSQIEARLRVADSLHQADEVFHLRSRLRNGDFEVGDRIIVSFDGIGLQRGDTMLVQAGKILRFGEPMGDLNLTGVLRPEVVDSVSNRVSKYFRNIVVRVTPLLRISLTGSVRAPGFYYARSDIPLSDFIMRSGGQDATADLDNTVIKRGTRVLWNAEDVRVAFRDGMTLDGLNLNPGDEIAVGSRATSDFWPKALQYGLPVVSALLLQIFLRR